MIKEAVILAGGEGKRMNAAVPKPLLEINGKTIIISKIEKLTAAGFEICLVVSEKSKNIFEQKLVDYPITYVVQGQEKGTAAALCAAKDFVKDDLFLVEMGDDVYYFDADKVRNYENPTVFGFEMEDVTGYGVLITDERGNVTDILEKQRSGKGIANTGMYIMPKSFFDLYKDIPVNEGNGERYLTNAISLLRKRGILFDAKNIEFWVGINTPEQLKIADTKVREIESLNNKRFQ